MRKRTPFIVAVVLAMTALAATAQRDASQQAVERIQKEVRHEILMLPYFDVFDNITFKVEGYDVTLSGQVVRPTLKTDARAGGQGHRGRGEGGQPDRGPAGLAQ